MKNTQSYKGYIGTVGYSAEDACLHGRITGIQDIISYEAKSAPEIQKAFEDAVDDYLNHCAEIKKEPDAPRQQSAG